MAGNGGADAGPRLPSRLMIACFFLKSHVWSDPAEAESSDGKRKIPSHAESSVVVRTSAVGETFKRRIYICSPPRGRGAALQSFPR